MTAPPVAAPSGGAEPSSAPDGFRDFVAGLNLVRVETLRVAAARNGHGDQERTDVAIESSVAVDSEQQALFFKYDLNARLFKADDAEIGTIEVSVVLVFGTPQPDPDLEMIEMFGGTSAYLIAHPYLREAAGSLALRLGFTGVTLPIVRP